MTNSPARPDRYAMTAEKLPAGARAVYDLAQADAGALISDAGRIRLTVTVDPTNAAPTVTLCGFAAVSFCGPADYEVWTPRPLPGCQSRTAGFADTPATAFGLALNVIRRAAVHPDWIQAVTAPAQVYDPAALISEARAAVTGALSLMGCAAHVSLISGPAVSISRGRVKAIIFAEVTGEGDPTGRFEIDIVQPGLDGRDRLSLIGFTDDAVTAARRAITEWVSAVITAG